MRRFCHFKKLMCCQLLLAAMACTTWAEPLLIAHRGASGYYPEHTLQAYRAAIEMGADFIEPDLVLTRDGHFVARHDIYLGSSTNVATVFPDRKTTLNGREGWFVSEFSLSEIKQLKARQPTIGRSDEFDDQFEIASLEDVIALAQSMDRRVGIYPELKKPAYFRSLGFSPEKLLVNVLQQYPDLPVLIQSFDADALRRLNELTDIELVMLVVPANRMKPGLPNVPLNQLRDFADGVAPAKSLLFSTSGQPRNFVYAAQALGLFVHVWTFRDDRLPKGINRGEDEIGLYLDIGVDGIFTDYPDTGRRALDQRR